MRSLTNMKPPGTHIATVCDKNYLIRAVTMCLSGMRHMPEATFWLLLPDDTKGVDMHDKRALPRLR